MLQHQDFGFIINCRFRISFKLKQNEIDFAACGKFMLVSLALRTFWVVQAHAVECMGSAKPVANCYSRHKMRIVWKATHQVRCSNRKKVQICYEHESFWDRKAFWNAYVFDLLWGPLLKHFFNGNFQAPLKYKQVSIQKSSPHQLSSLLPSVFCCI